MKTLKFLLSIVLINVIAFTAIANNAEWINLTNGRHITSMAEDATNMWIGTKGGLVQLDKQTRAMTYYNVANSGLPSNQVEALDVDPQGNVWIGTYDQGLVMFNGTSWEVYNQDNSDLETNQIYTLQVDDYGNVWIGVLFYLIKFDGQNFTNFEIPAYAAATSVSIADSNDILLTWNAGNNQGSQLFHFNGDTIVEQFGFYGNGAYKFYDDTNGDTWLCFNGGVAKRDGGTWRYFDAFNSDLPNVQARGFTELNGVLYLGTDAGVYKYENNTWQAYNTHVSDVKYLLGNAEGLWIGTEFDGLTLQNGTAISQYHTSNSNIPFDYATAMDLVDGNMRFVSNLGNLMYQFDGNDWLQSDLNLPDSLGYGKIIARGANGVLWVLRNNILYKFDGASQQQWDMGVLGISYTGTFLMKEAPDGKLYMASYNNGVFVFDGTNFTQYTRLNSSISSSKIRDFAFKDGLVYIGTYVDLVSSVYYGGGLEVFDGSTFTRLHSGNSAIPSDYIQALLADSTGLWILTEYNLTRYENSTWTNYTLAQMGMTDIGFLKRFKADPNGDLWFIGPDNNSKGVLMRWDGTNLESFNGTNSPIWDFEYQLRDWEFDAAGNLWLSHASGMFIYKQGGVTGVSETIEQVVGLDDHKLPLVKVSVYPNPVVEQLNFVWNAEVQGELNLMIYDITGQLTVQQNLNVVAGEQTTVNMGGLNKGYYFYQVTDRNGNQLKASGKLLKGQ